MRVDTDDLEVVNTTSRSNNWSRGLSPMIVGPCYLYGNRFARNVENAWQFSKVYRCYVDSNNSEPIDDWWKWSEQGFNQERGVRYPMGKGQVPLYSYWNSDHLSYVEARKQIYVPMYQSAVRGTEAFWKLRQLHKKTGIALWDFDVAYTEDDPTENFTRVINNPKQKLGHEIGRAHV
jgi:hypothetical protein